MGGQASRRHDIRLRDYDYATPGVYHVVISQKDRLALFGSVTESGVLLSGAGRMVEEQWLQIPVRFPWASLDDYVVMPDHLHGLVVLGGSPDIQLRTSLGQIIGAFKSFTTLRYGQGVREQGWPGYAGKLWLENYYERVVRNDRELERFRGYIADNPYRWLEAQRQNRLPPV